jgi:hypothetical protein
MALREHQDKRLNYSAKTHDIWRNAHEIGRLKLKDFIDRRNFIKTSPQSFLNAHLQMKYEIIDQWSVGKSFFIE